MAAMKAQGRSLRAIAAEMQAKGHQISHVGVQSVLRGRREPLEYLEAGGAWEGAGR